VELVTEVPKEPVELPAKEPPCWFNEPREPELRESLDPEPDDLATSKIRITTTMATIAATTKFIWVGYTIL